MLQVTKNWKLEKLGNEAKTIYVTSIPSRQSIPGSFQEISPEAQQPREVYITQ